MRSILLVLTLVFLQYLAATDRFFGNISATSPSGNFMVKAKSPDNDKKRRIPFQRNFVFSLHRTHDGAVLWTYVQGKEERSPESIWVSDSGMVVVDACNELWTIDLQGTKIDYGFMTDYIPKQEKDVFCQFTTAGLFWQQYSISEFIKIGAVEYFFLRTYWGRMIVLRPAATALIVDPDVDEAIEKQLVPRIEALIAGATEKTVKTFHDSCGEYHWSDTMLSGLCLLRRHSIPVENPVFDPLFASKKQQDEDFLRSYKLIPSPIKIVFLSSWAVTGIGILVIAIILGMFLFAWKKIRVSRCSK